MRRRRWASQLANAVGLLVAALVLDGMGVDATAFIIAVAIYTVVLALMTPFMGATCWPTTRAM
ncbi:MAG: hypothetical protein M3516_01565 [Actinomycetota bacterium]|nr:hypothetical protein [Actinomycetota bacterium]